MKKLPGLLISWAVLFLLWLLFVDQTSRSELLAGSAAALLASLAWQITVKVGPVHFQPRLAWLTQLWRLPFIILQDFRVLLRVLADRLASKPVPGTFQLARFDSFGDDSREGARRALVILFLSVSPNSVVVGIDPDRGILLLHQLVPTPVPTLKCKLEEN